jgi:hypothetical protein
MCHAETFFATRYARQKLLRFNRPIFYRLGVTAVITVFTIPFKSFAKITELNSAATIGSFRVIDYLTQLLAGNSLFFGIGFLLDEIINGADISSTEEEGTMCRSPSRPARPDS